MTRFARLAARSSTDQVLDWSDTVRAVLAGTADPDQLDVEVVCDPPACPPVAPAGSDVDASS